MRKEGNMGVWRDQYGVRNRDFIDGVKAGVKMFAVWQEGKQVVGVMERPLEKELAEIEEDLSDKPEEPKKKKPSCYECAHRGTLPGDAHSKCLHPDVKAIAEDPLATLAGMFASVGREPPIPYPSIGKKLNIKGSKHGVMKGWFNWPVNFDPVWLENCDGFYPKDLPPSAFMSFKEARETKGE